MEKERKIKVLIVVALIVAILGLTASFAALSQTLTIKGTANMEPANWDVHLRQRLTHIEDSGKSIHSPTLSDDGFSITGFEVSLTKPQDAVIFTFDIVNAGEIDAKLSDILVNNISMAQAKSECEAADNYDTCSNKYIKELANQLVEEADWDGDKETTEEEKLKALEYIEISLESYDNDGCHILPDGETTRCYKDSDFSQLELFPDSASTNILKPNHVSIYYILFSFDRSADTLPKGNVILEPELKFVFTQN